MNKITITLSNIENGYKKDQKITICPNIDLSIEEIAGYIETGGNTGFKEIIEELKEDKKTLEKQLDSDFIIEEYFLGTKYFKKGTKEFIENIENPLKNKINTLVEERRDLILGLRIFGLTIIILLILNLFLYFN